MSFMIIKYSKKLLNAKVDMLNKIVTRNYIKKAALSYFTHSVALSRESLPITFLDNLLQR